MRVFRVELEYGTGPYTVASPVKYVLQAKHNGSNKHPVSYSDCDGFNDCHSCGFISIPQLKEWFAGFLRLLHKNKFVISEYNIQVDIAVYGSRQIGFEKATAIKVRQYSILTKKIALPAIEG